MLKIEVGKTYRSRDASFTVKIDTKYPNCGVFSGPKSTTGHALSVFGSGRTNGTYESPNDLVEEVFSAEYLLAQLAEIQKAKQCLVEEETRVQAAIKLLPRAEPDVWMCMDEKTRKVYSVHKEGKQRALNNGVNLRWNHPERAVAVVPLVPDYSKAEVYTTEKAVASSNLCPIALKNERIETIL